MPTRGAGPPPSTRDTQAPPHIPLHRNQTECYGRIRREAEPAIFRCATLSHEPVSAPFELFFLTTRCVGS